MYMACLSSQIYMGNKCDKYDKYPYFTIVELGQLMIAMIFFPLEMVYV